jgi:hypothetical protein
MLSMHMKNSQLLQGRTRVSLNKILVFSATKYMQRMIYCTFRSVVRVGTNVITKMKDKQNSEDDSTEPMQRYSSNDYSTAIASAP